MTRLYSLLFAAAAVAAMLASTPMPAQISVGINLGPAPVCPYGYFDYAPYRCSPYGYYGPEWFNGGVFRGAGPWYHADRGFYGHVDNRYDPHHGYRGPFPAQNDQRFNHFHGNEWRDGQGHAHSEADHEHFGGDHRPH